MQARIPPQIGAGHRSPKKFLLKNLQIIMGDCLCLSNYGLYFKYDFLKEGIMPILLRYLVLSFALLTITGCNVFSWTASVDESDDYGLLIAEARAQMTAGDPEKAVHYFTRALSLRTNDAPALDGRVEARLLILTAGRSIYTAMPFLFETNGSSRGKLFTQSSLVLTRYLEITQAVVSDINLLETHPSLTNSPHTTRLSADAAIANGLTALLLAADGNTNGIPGEKSDPFTLAADFSLRQNFDSNDLSWLEGVSHHAVAASLWLHRLTITAPQAMTLGSPLSTLHISLVRFASNLAEMRR
jgi:hypothetical protein